MNNENPFMTEYIRNIIFVYIITSYDNIIRVEMYKKQQRKNVNHVMIECAKKSAVIFLLCELGAHFLYPEIKLNLLIMRF